MRESILKSWKETHRAHAASRFNKLINLWHGEKFNSRNIFLTRPFAAVWEIALMRSGDWAMLEDLCTIIG